MSIQVKRAYEPPAPGDGYRVLVDRLWPRGVSKEKLELDEWHKEIAPSDTLRKWFGHDPEKWAEFEERYFAELDEQPDQVQELLQHANSGPLTLVYGAKDEEHNNAVALRKYLELYRPSSP
ncbi:MAG: DUF488 domain-containing protein [Anaerolineae bacterium]